MKLCHIGTNQYEAVFDNNVVVLYSYSTPVAARVPGHGTVKSEVTYSRTTSKHIGLWTHGTSKNIDTVPQAYLDALVRNNGVAAWPGEVIPTAPAPERQRHPRGWRA